MKPCTIVLTPLEKSVIAKYECKIDPAKSDKDDDEADFLVKKYPHKKIANKSKLLSSSSSSEDEDNKEKKTLDYAKNVGQKVSSKPPPGATKKLIEAEKQAAAKIRSVTYPSVSSDEEIIIDEESSSQTKQNIAIISSDEDSEKEAEKFKKFTAQRNMFGPMSKAAPEVSSLKPKLVENEEEKATRAALLSKKLSEVGLLISSSSEDSNDGSSLPTLPKKQVFEKPPLAPTTSCISVSKKVSSNQRTTILIGASDRHG